MEPIDPRPLPERYEGFGKPGGYVPGWWYVEQTKTGPEFWNIYFTGADGNIYRWDWLENELANVPTFTGPGALEAAMDYYNSTLQKNYFTEGFSGQDPWRIGLLAYGGEGNGNDSEESFSIDGKFTIGVQVGGLAGLGGKYGIFANLMSWTLAGYNSTEKDWIFPGNRRYGYTHWNQSLSGGFIIGGEISRTFDAGFQSRGAINDNINFTASFGPEGNILGINATYNMDGSTSYSINIPIRKTKASDPSGAFMLLDFPKASDS